MRRTLIFASSRRFTCWLSLASGLGFQRFILSELQVTHGYFFRPFSLINEKCYERLSPVLCRQEKEGSNMGTPKYLPGSLHSSNIPTIFLGFLPACSLRPALRLISNTFREPFTLNPAGKKGTMSTAMKTAALKGLERIWGISLVELWSQISHSLYNGLGFRV